MNGVKEKKVQQSCNTLICLDKYCKSAIILIIITALCIIFPFIRINLSYLDDYFNIFNYAIRGWVISHFVLYFIVGLLCHNQFLLFLLIGTGWELFEYSSYLYTKNKFWTNNQTTFQYGDIIANTLGYLIGGITKKVFF